jgi:hypothetical protein
MRDELEMILEGNSPGLIEVTPRDLSSGTKKRRRKSSVRLPGVRSEIRTEHLKNRNLKYWLVSTFIGHAIAQTISRRLPTEAALVQAYVISCGICGGQSGIGAGFLRALRFPLTIFIPPTAPHSSSIIRGG